MGAPRFLELAYQQARIYQFCNFWNSRDVKDFQYVVEIRLTPPQHEFSLSPRDRWLE